MAVPLLLRVSVDIAVEEGLIVIIVGKTYDEFGGTVVYEVKLVPTAVPVKIAELEAAPADAFTADGMSLATEEATMVTVTVCETDALVVMLLTSRMLGRRCLPLRLRSPGTYVVLGEVGEAFVVASQRISHDPILALVAATHLPFAGIEPTRSVQA